MRAFVGRMRVGRRVAVRVGPPVDGGQIVVRTEARRPRGSVGSLPPGMLGLGDELELLARLEMQQMLGKKVRGGNEEKMEDQKKTTPGNRWPYAFLGRIVVDGDKVLVPGADK